MSALKSPTTIAESKGAGLSWSRLLQWSAAAMAVALLVLMFLLGGVIPPIIVFAALFALAAWFYRRKERAGSIVLAVLFVILLLTNLPFIIPSLAVPASTLDFLPTVIVTIVAIVGAVSAIAVIRRRGAATDGGARMVALGAVTLLVVATAVTIIAKIAYPNITARSGDIAIVTEDFEFSEQDITAREGRVAVFVENKDTTLHTFTIEELGVDLPVPAGEPARIAFDADPGTYEFICRPHAPGMSGTLEVSG
jgi:plastocyanin